MGWYCCLDRRNRRWKDLEIQGWKTRDVAPFEGFLFFYFSHFSANLGNPKSKQSILEFPLTDIFCFTALDVPESPSPVQNVMCALFSHSLFKVYIFSVLTKNLISRSGRMSKICDITNWKPIMVQYWAHTGVMWKLPGHVHCEWNDYVRHFGCTFHLQISEWCSLSAHVKFWGGG